MSIFPKKITNDESVIIHIRIINYDNNIKFLKLYTYIEDPNGKIVKHFKKDLLLSLNSNTDTYKDLYFEYKPSKKCVIGKYKAYTNLYYKGEVLHSLTSDNDYFFIEKLNINFINKDSKKFRIVNNSLVSTSYQFLFLKDDDIKVENLIMNPNESKFFDFENRDYDKLFLKYGNNYCERIINKKTNPIYVKNPLFNWEIIEDSLILKNNKKKLKLDNFTAYVWLSCDGINTIYDIIKETNSNFNIINNKIKKLKIMKLIYRVH